MAQNVTQYPKHEHAFIGSILLSPNKSTELLNSCSHEMFVTRSHSSVIAAMKHLVDAGEPVDILLLTTRLVELGWSKDAVSNYLLNITNGDFVSANALWYLQKVKEAWALREIEKAQQEELPPLQKAQKLREIAETVESELVTHEVVDTTAEALKYAIDTINEPLDGLRTSLPFSDDIPLHKSFYTVIAALSGTGKTIMGTQMAYELLKQKKKVAYISTEMSGSALFKRMFAQSTKTTAGHVMTGSVSSAAKKALQEEFSEFDFILADKENATVEGIYRMCEKQRPDIVFVDYIQRTHTEKEFKDNEVARLTHITRTLKSITIDFEIPVVTFAQFNRIASSLKTPPSLEVALKGASSIFEDADLAMLLWRDTDNETKKKLDTGIIRVEKYRHGPQPDDYNIVLDKQHMLFKEKEKESVFNGTIT